MQSGRVDNRWRYQIYNFQMNPQHQIPVLKDGDNFTLSESRAIAIYLVEQFGGEGKVHAVLRAQMNLL